MKRAWFWLRRELKRLFPVWLFFFLMFSLLRLTQLVALREYGIDVASPSLVLVGSLVIGKVVLIADHFSFMERFRERPLIYGTLWKGSIYYLGCLFFEFLDRVPSILRLHEPFRQAFDGIFAKVATGRFWLIQLWLVILILGFSAVRELARILGPDQFRALFFGRRRPSVKYPPPRRVA